MAHTHWIRCFSRPGIQGMGFHDLGREITDEDQDCVRISIECGQPDTPPPESEEHRRSTIQGRERFITKGREANEQSLSWVTPLAAGWRIDLDGLCNTIPTLKQFEWFGGQVVVPPCYEVESKLAFLEYDYDVLVSLYIRPDMVNRDPHNLLARMTAIPSGRDMAYEYQRAMLEFLTVLFDSALDHPAYESPLHDGQQRVDIVFRNVAHRGFFDWLRMHYAAPYIFIECKNLTSQPANRELHQLLGRFSRERGKVGFLVCRELQAKKSFIERCRSSASDGQGFIIPLDDEDLGEMARTKDRSEDPLAFPLLSERFGALVK